LELNTSPTIALGKHSSPPPPLRASCAIKVGGT
jgi:hypothetical protein